MLCDWQRYPAIITKIYCIYRLRFFLSMVLRCARFARESSAINYFLHILIFNNPWIHHFHIDHNALCLRPLPPPNICIIILSNFSKVLRSYQEKSKTMVMQNLGGKQRARIQYFPIFQFPVFQCLTRIAPKPSGSRHDMRVRRKRMRSII